MRERIHKRFSPEFVRMVLESFNQGRISEARPCELIGVERSRTI